MNRVARSRRDNVDLLVGSGTPNRVEPRLEPLLIDPAEQLAELADLVDRGLVSPEEFARQRRKVFGS
jgi:hypothetical protein